MEVQRDKLGPGKHGNKRKRGMCKEKEECEDELCKIGGKNK